MGVVPVHWVLLVLEHWPQAPDDWQAGVAPPQSVSPAQARQRWVEVSQRGVAPVHWTLFPAEHWPQAPEVSQAGVAPPHSLSPEQARQVRKAGSQTGVAPEQSASARQGTQVPAGV